MAGVKVPGELRQFVILRTDVEAVLQRCGLDTWDMLLIDLYGVWTRWVFTSEENARWVAADLGVPLHDGWDNRTTKRMGRNDPWNTSEGKRRAL